ncbi:MAG: elongation factor 4 [Chloroflexi bacterium]|nr:elongation factor 4 [Chloroflexota bacterium]
MSTDRFPLERIRNFCIIAHIDHGKSTLSDRLLELTGTLEKRQMTDQVLDRMELEREKGITIKAKAVRMHYNAPDGERYELNLIDTPGHVDFSYEVSHALSACEGALLVVDATQGIEAQTLANLYLAIDKDLEIVPIVNKIDLPSARPDEVAEELENLIGCHAEEVLQVSAKDGIGIETVLPAVVANIQPPEGNPDAPLRALIFDSHYDAYKGVIAYLRVVDGVIQANQPLMLISTGKTFEGLEVGVFRPDMQPIEALYAGEVGYIATGMKTVRDCRVGDTITTQQDGALEALYGYKPPKPMVFAGIYPVDNDDYQALREALEKLQLNDASLVYEPETSAALNQGFRCGFLGLLHMEIVQERLEREYSLDLIATSPSVEYQVELTNGETHLVDNPEELPDESAIAEIREPWMRITIYTPPDFIGTLMEMTTKCRGEYVRIDYLDEHRVALEFNIPLSEILVDFHDELKARSRGYASLDYTLGEYRAADLTKLTVLVNEEPVDALSIIIHRDQAYAKGAAMVRKMKEVIPPQMFRVPIQAAVGGKVVARANVSEMRKDVLAKCYGGDISRKRKLLERQKEGKRRMKRVGKVDIPQEAFMAVLKLDD